jgi:hypothetical protein
MTAGTSAAPVFGPTGRGTRIRIAGLRRRLLLVPSTLPLAALLPKLKRDQEYRAGGEGKVGVGGESRKDSPARAVVRHEPVYPKGDHEHDGNYDPNGVFPEQQAQIEFCFFGRSALQFPLPGRVGWIRYWKSRGRGLVLYLWRRGGQISPLAAVQFENGSSARP